MKFFCEHLVIGGVGFMSTHPLAQRIYLTMRYPLFSWITKGFNIVMLLKYIPYFYIKRKIETWNLGAHAKNLCMENYHCMCPIKRGRGYFEHFGKSLTFNVMLKRA